MRILISVDPEIPVPPLLYGGIERIVAMLIVELRQAGHEVGLLAHPKSTCEVDAFFPWPALTSGGSTAIARNSLALRRAVRRYEPDVVHSFSRLAYLLSLLDTKVPRIMSFQREPTPRTVAWSARLAPRSLCFTGCSEYISQQGRRAGGTWFAIPNFTDVSRFTFQSRIEPDAPLLFLSRIERIKGAHTAIAIAKAAGRRLVLAGNHATSGPELEYWNSDVAPHIDGDLVEYVGPVNDVQKNALLGSAFGLVVPIEWNEPFGIVFAEALACGTPILSCPRGALPEIVRPGIDGFLTARVEDLIASVDRLAEIDRADCRRRAEACFSSTVAAAMYDRLYQSVSA